MATLPRVVLIDGTWLLFRAFHALPAELRTAGGLHTNTVLGFATMFRKLFAGRAPAAGAVVFDASGPTHRHLKYPSYKAQRAPMPPELREQLPLVDRLVVAQGFPLVRVPGWEGDDVIGTLAQQAVDAGHEVLIVAGDKDFAQLISDKVKMYDPMRDVTFDAVLVFKKWGVRPDQIIDMLALLGDSVDNIPGVPGIGEKGATTLLEKYGSLDQIYASLDQLTPRQRTALDSQREAAYLSRDLATIVRDAPLPLTVAALGPPRPDFEALQALYRELELYSLLDTDKKVESPALPVRDEPFVPGGGLVAVVPVLAGTEGGAGVLSSLLVCEKPGEIYRIVDVAQASWLADPEVPKVAHDVKLLAKALKRLGVELFGADDTMLASFLVNPTRCIPHRIEQVVREYLQVPLAPDASPEQRADVLVRLWPVLAERLAAAGLTQHYESVELPLAGVLGEMELSGILVDREDLGKLGVEFGARKDEIEARIITLAGHPFNLGSTSQLGTVLFEELKLPVIKKTKTGWSTDAEVLEALAPQHEIARLLLEHRMFAKLINTYTDVLQKAVDPQTGRVHATFMQTVGVSGRLISTDPDLQRTPVRTPEGRRIRRAFVAPPGSRLLSADWSQIELRVLAHFSGDPLLVEAFRVGADVHRQTASRLFGVALDAVTPEQRGVGKTVNFATIYGQGATALSQILGIPRKEASAHIEAFFRTYGGVRSWLDATIREATACGYVTTLLGRRRYLPELSSQGSQERQAGERIAANTPIQGSAADLCKLAMLRLSEDLRGSSARMLLQVHDELVFEVAESEVDAVAAIVREAMVCPSPELELSVPLVVNVGVGANWSEAH